MNKEELVKDLAEYHRKLNIPLFTTNPDHKEVKDWFAEVAGILKQLDEGDYQVFNELKDDYYQWGSEHLEQNANKIDRFVRQKVAEYKRYDFSPETEDVEMGREICIPLPNIKIPEWIKSHIPELLITIIGGLIVAFLAFLFGWI